MGKISFKKSLILLMALIIFPVLLIFAYISYQTFQNRYNQELQANLEVANAVSEIFEEFVVDVLRQEAGIGHILSVPKSFTKKEINILLAKSRAEYKSIKTFRWVSPNGIIIASDMPGSIGYDLSYFPYIKEIINGKDWVVSDLYRGILTNELVFVISKAVRDDSGVLLGIIVAVIDEAHLDQEFSLYRTSGGGISLIDSKGMLVYRFPRIEADWEQRNWLKKNPDLQKALDGNIRIGTAYAPFEENKKIFANVPISFGWVASAGRSQAEVMAPIYEDTFKRAVLFLLVLVAGIILPILLSRRVVKSVKKLKGYSDSVGRGKYTFDSYNFLISEFQQLADSFKATTDQVRLREEALIKDKVILDGIINSTDIQLVHLDNDFNFLAVNNAYANRCNKTPAELIGRNHFELFPNPEYESIFKRIRNTGIRESFKDTPFEFPDQPEHGITFWNWSLAPIRNKGKVIGLALALRETTDYKKAQDQLQSQAIMLEESRNELKLANEQLEQKVLQRTGELEFANLQLKSANDELKWRAAKLRALASDLTMVEQRVRREIAKILHDHLQQILAAAKFQVQTLSLLDYRGLQTAQTELDNQLGEAIQVSRSLTVQLSPPVLFDSGLPAGLDWLCRWMDEKHKFKVQLKVEQKVPKIADDVKLFLFESVRELLFNAVKHANVSTASVTLRQLDEQYIKLVVSDNGIGFDPKVLKSSADSYKGFGLFSIIERIPLFGGTINIDSSPGHGSRFSLNVPIASN